MSNNGSLDWVSKMSINFGDRVVYIDKDNNGACIKGTIIDILRNTNEEITDYLVSLDLGPVVYIKSNIAGWFPLYDHILYFKNNRLSISFLNLVFNRRPALLDRCNQVKVL